MSSSIYIDDLKIALNGVIEVNRISLAFMYHKRKAARFFMDEHILEKFLHDMASPLGSLMLLTDEDSPTKPMVGMMAALLSMYRSICFARALSREDVQKNLDRIACYYGVHLKLNLEESTSPLYKNVLITGFLLCKINAKGVVEISVNDSAMTIYAQHKDIKHDHPLFTLVSEN